MNHTPVMTFNSCFCYPSPPDSIELVVAEEEACYGRLTNMPTFAEMDEMQKALQKIDEEARANSNDAFSEFELTSI